MAVSCSRTIENQLNEFSSVIKLYYYSLKEREYERITIHREKVFK